MIGCEILVEIMETGNSPEHYYEFTKLQMFQENVFCFTPKGAVIKLPKGCYPYRFCLCSPHKHWQYRDWL